MKTIYVVVRDGKPLAMYTKSPDAHEHAATLITEHAVPVNTLRVIPQKLYDHFTKDHLTQ